MAETEKPKGGKADKPQKDGKGQGGKPGTDAKRAGGKGKGADAKGEKPAPTPRPADYKPRLKEHYAKVVRDTLQKKFSYANPMQIPRLEKIVLNMGVGEAVADRKKVENAAGDLALIAGQRPVVTRARKSIATYKVRENMASAPR